MDSFESNENPVCLAGALNQQHPTLYDIQQQQKQRAFPEPSNGICDACRSILVDNGSGF
jgi:hypothetical protein